MSAVKPSRAVLAFHPVCVFPCLLRHSISLSSSPDLCTSAWQGPGHGAAHSTLFRWQAPPPCDLHTSGQRYSQSAYRDESAPLPSHSSLTAFRFDRQILDHRATHA